MRALQNLLLVGIATTLGASAATAFDFKSLTNKLQKGIEDSLQQGAKKKTDELMGNPSSNPSPTPNQPSIGGPQAADPRKDKALVKQTQGRLNALGYDVGTPDGIFGNKTAAAIRAFQKDQNLPQSGLPSDGLLATLNQTTTQASPATTAALAAPSGAAGAVPGPLGTAGSMPELSGASGTPATSAAAAPGVITPLAGSPGLKPITLKTRFGGVYMEHQLDYQNNPKDDFSRWVDFMVVGAAPEVIKKFPNVFAFRHLVAQERNDFLKCKFVVSHSYHCKSGVQYHVWRGANEFAQSDTQKSFIALYEPKLRSAAVSLPKDVTLVERVQVREYSKSGGGFVLSRLGDQWTFPATTFRIQRPYAFPEIWPISETEARQVVDLLEKQGSSPSTKIRQAYVLTRIQITSIGDGEPRIPFSGILKTKLKDVTLYRSKALNQVLHRFKFESMSPQNLVSSQHGPNEVTLLAHLVKRAGSQADSIDNLVRRLNYNENEFAQREAIETARKAFQIALNDVTGKERLSLQGHVQLGSYDFENKQFPVTVSSINSTTGEPWEVLPRRNPNERYVSLQTSKRELPPFKLSAEAAQKLLGQFDGKSRSLEARFIAVSSGGKLHKNSSSLGSLDVAILRADLLPPGQKATSDATALVSLGATSETATTVGGSDIPAPPGNDATAHADKASGPFALENIPTGAYGQDIVGIRLGSSMQQAEQLIAKHMSVARTLVTKSGDTTDDGYQSAKLFVSKNGSEQIVLYNGPAQASEKVVALVRWLKRPAGSLPKDAVFNKLRSKYGKESDSQSNWLTWAENGNVSDPCLMHDAPAQHDWYDGNGKPVAVGEMPGMEWDARKANTSGKKAGYEACGAAVFASVDQGKNGDELVMRLYDQRAYSTFMLNAEPPQPTKSVDLKL